MPSYVITGASRGLGYAFVKHLAQDPQNTVIGLARNVPATQKRLAADGITNVHVFAADIVDFEALKAAAAETARITGGALDVLVNNAALVSEESKGTTLAAAETNVDAVAADLAKSFDVNVTGVLKTITAFLPFLRKSPAGRVIAITTGMADIDLINTFRVPVATPYSVSKGALNVLIAKYHAAYAGEGLLFMGISPGFVATAEDKTFSEEERAGLEGMVKAFKSYAPGFEGPITPAKSVEMVLGVVERATIEKDGGAFVSHYGNKQWL